MLSILTSVEFCRLVELQIATELCPDWWGLPLKGWKAWCEKEKMLVTAQSDQGQYFSQFP